MGWFGRKKAPSSPPPPPPEQTDPVMDLPAMVLALQTTAPAVAQAPVDPILLRALWGDLCRDARESRPGADAFEALKTEDDQRRALLLIHALRAQPGAADLFEEGACDRTPEGHVRCALILPATQLDLLTPQLIAESPLRAEEFARAFAASLGVEIQGESEATSEEALRRLDYRRLLAGAHRAKAKAAEKMDYLKTLYAEQEAHRPRGKW
jgi:hypothetical protein